jgi:hypothetical protein
LIVAACGAGPDPTANPGTTEPPSTLPASPSTTAPAQIPTTDGVAVIVTATPVEQPDGSVELCPPGRSGPCPGIALAGEIDHEMLTTEGTPTVVQVSGVYDGRSLTPSSDPIAIDYPPIAEPDFSSLCPDLHGTASVNPDEDLQTSIGTYIEQQPDFAEMWWDRESAILTIWFKGEDVKAHRTAIESLAEGEPVCVAGGADFSLAELLEASNLIQSFRDSRGQPLATGGYGVGGLENRIDLAVEEIDVATRIALTELVGERVVLYPFIELIEADLSALPPPKPAIEGDVDILTSDVRNAGGMAALGHFTLSYDLDLNCVYFGDPGSDERIVPVWPFGYSATNDPMTVYDYDGNPVAGEGDEIELGGGNVGLSGIEGETCGATSSWIVSSF